MSIDTKASKAPRLGSHQTEPEPPIDIYRDLAEILAAFVRAPAEEVDSLINRSLEQLGLLLDMDVATVLIHDPEHAFYRVTHEWLGPSLDRDPVFLGLRVDDSFSWLNSELEKDEPFLISRIDEWPAQALAERQTCLKVGIKSVLWVPFRGGNQLRGYIAYNTTRRERTWDELTINRLRLYGQIIASALIRSQMEQESLKIREFEELLIHISADFVRLSFTEMDAGIDMSLKAIGECLEMKRVFLIEFVDRERDRVGGIRGWIAEGHEDNAQLHTSLFERELAWAATQLRTGQPLICEDVESLPDEASSEKNYLQSIGIRSGILLPIPVQGELIGVLVTDSVKLNPQWSDELAQRLPLLSELFVSLLTRRQVHQELEFRLGLEHHLIGLAKTFIDVPPELIDDRIMDGLKSTGELFGVDRCCLARFSDDRDGLTGSYLWAAPGISTDDPLFKDGQKIEFKWVTSKLKSGESVIFSDSDDIPESAVGERRYAAQEGLQSTVLIPLMVSEQVLGCFAVDMIRSVRKWSENIIQNLWMTSEVFSNALMRKYHWEQLRERDQLIETTLQRAPAGVVLADLQGLIQQANPRFCNLLGYDREELYGKHIGDLIHPDDDHLSEEVLRNMDSGTAESKPHDKRYLHKDGSEVWASVYTYRLDDALGRPFYIAAVIIDISERKVAEINLKKALDEISELKNRLEAENVHLHEEIKLRDGREEILGNSSRIRAVLELIELVAENQTSVLIQGETGVGKELVARAIHRLSTRRERPMVTVNCAALPGSLIEAELFGREKGAFTGALTRQPGRFELADKSTLFLDEVSELPLDLQAKLLRVLETGEFERLGGIKTLKADVRLVTATNRDLGRLVDEGRFRDDLYYRLSVFPIEVPPLRERIEDIAILVWAFVQEFGEHMGKTIEVLPSEDMKRMKTYDWPGNVRELRNIVERAMILSRGGRLHVQLPTARNLQESPEAISMVEVERRHIISILEQTQWRVRGKGGAAELLILNPSTLESRMKKLGIRRPA